MKSLRLTSGANLLNTNDITFKKGKYYSTIWRSTSNLDVIHLVEWPKIYLCKAYI